MRYGKLAIGCVVVLLIVGSGRAERKYKLGVSLDFIGGGSNYSGSNDFIFAQVKKGIMPFYSMYPSFRLDSKGQRSNTFLSYAVTFEQFPSHSELTSISHLFSFGYDARISKRARLTITESLSTLPDFSTLSVIKGISMTPQGFRYVFEPSLQKSSNLNNGAIGRLYVELTAHSYLEFSISSNYRRYNEAAELPRYFPDQKRTEGSAGYSHKMNPHRTLSLRYSVYQNSFENYPTMRGHRAGLGYAEEITPSLNISLEGGPSFSEDSQLYSENIGYFISASVMKTLHANQFSANYSYRGADSTGFGYIVDSHQGGIGFRRTLGKKASLGLDVSGFHQKHSVSNGFDYWGFQGSLGLSRTLWEHWVITVGGSYGSYTGQAPANDSKYKRFYAAFGYRLPELWRASK